MNLSGYLALIQLLLEYSGKTAHAALSPWEGRNALDAGVLAYTNVGLLRQQIKPTHRIHGILEGRDWVPNVIPDKCGMNWFVRAPSVTEAQETAARVKSCFQAAAIATGTEVKFKEEDVTDDLIQNTVLGKELADVVLKRYGAFDFEPGISSVSTDFGNISYLMPGLHPKFSIPTVPGGGNHTKEFAEAAASDVAHEACYTVSKALAHVGMRVITDAEFMEKVRDAFEKQKKSKGF